MTIQDRQKTLIALGYFLAIKKLKKQLVLRTRKHQKIKTTPRSPKHIWRYNNRKLLLDKQINKPLKSTKPNN